jgi:hypothetical protein
MGSRKQFSPESKREAVQLLETGSWPASEIARSGLPGINSTMTDQVSRPWREGIPQFTGAQGADDPDYPTESRTCARHGGAGHFEKPSRTLPRGRGEVQMHQREFDVRRLCYVLQGSRSGFYAWAAPGDECRSAGESGAHGSDASAPSADAGSLWGAHEVRTLEARRPGLRATPSGVIAATGWDRGLAPSALYPYRAGPPA